MADRRLADLRDRVDQLVDALGKPIDDGIKETIVYLLALRFPTSASCEGHLWKHRATKGPYIVPWVQIEAAEPIGWGKSAKKKKQLQLKNHHLQWKMLAMLTKFYRHRFVPADVRLIIRNIGNTGCFRITSQCCNMVEFLSRKKQKEQQALCRTEMHLFTKFLRSMYKAK